MNKRKSSEPVQNDLARGKLDLSAQRGYASPPKIGLIGAGNRGQIYTDWLLSNPSAGRLIAVAEPLPDRRKDIADAHRLKADACFTDWPEMLNSYIELDGIIIANDDRGHLGPAMASLSAGLHVLLEKPMATEESEIDKLCTAANAAEQRGGSLTVCHVLRYSPFFRQLKAIVANGELGEIISLYHAENISWYHYVHSYVRGNWGNSRRSSPLILAKSSHDLDVICWLVDAKPLHLASQGGRRIFMADNAPVAAPNRCADACPLAATCPYEAESHYLYGLPIKRALAQAPGLLGLTARLILRWPQMFKYLPGLSKYYYWRDWPTNTIGSNLSPEGIRQTLAETNFGRCAYRCDNDQLEHQETLIEFDSGATAVFRLHGLSHTEGRTMRIDGTKATLRARFGSGSQITVYPHHGKSPRNYPVDSDFIGHKQADALLMTEWSQILQGKPSPTNAKISALSHYLALAAQRAVTSKCWQNLNELTQ